MEAIAENDINQKSGKTHRVAKSIGIAMHAAIVGFRQSYYQGDTLDSIMGYVDALTSIPNRKAFERDKSSFREGYALVLIDIDNFKNINDAKGHVYGDAILKRFASILTGAAGEGGKAYRIGGDEFVAFVRLAAMESFCAEIKKSMQKENSFTISQGITPLIAHDTCEAAMETVDAALYHAKHNGKNGACCFDLPKVKQYPLVGTRRSPYFPLKLLLYQRETNGRRRLRDAGSVAFSGGGECSLTQSFIGGLTRAVTNAADCGAE